MQNLRDASNKLAMSNNDTIKVEIKGKGKQPIPLLSVADAFKELNHAIDKSYLSISNKRKLSKSDKEHYKILAEDIKSGSVIADLLIIVPPLVQTAFAFQAASTGLSVKNIWELTINSFNFLKGVAELRHKGQSPKIIQHQNPYSLNIVNFGTIEIGDIVYNNALRSEQNIKNLARIVDEKNVSNFSALDKSNNGIVLTPKENKLFNPATFIDKNSIEIIAKLYRLDVETKSGRLRVLEGEYQGEYPFKIIGRQPISSYIHALGEKQSKLSVLKELIKHPAGNETLAGFQLIDISNERGELFPELF